jgi:predicted DNA-binding transcriptional regulator AlpA
VTAPPRLTPASTPDLAERILSTDDVMALLGISRATVTRWVAAGRLVPLKRLASARNAAYIFDVETMTPATVEAEAA